MRVRSETSGVQSVSNRWNLWLKYPEDLYGLPLLSAGRLPAVSRPPRLGTIELRFPRRLAAAGGYQNALSHRYRSHSKYLALLLKDRADPSIPLGC